MSGTNLGKMPILIVSLVIGIVMATTAIVPLVSDYSDARTITNDGYFRSDHYASDDTGSFTIEWDNTMTDYVMVNNEKVNINVPSSMSFTLVFDTAWLIRAVSNSNADITGVQFYRSISGTVSLTEFELVCSSGAYTINGKNNGTAITEITGNYTDLYIPATNGEYVMKDKNTPAIVREDSDFIAYGLTNLVNPADTTTTLDNVGYMIVGSIEDGATISNWRINTLSGYTLTNGDPTINYEDSSEWIDCYDLSSITFVSTLTSNNDSTVTANTNVTYSFFLVPAEIEDVDPNNPDAYKALVKVVPVMAFVALIAAAAYMIYSKRD